MNGNFPESVVLHRKVQVSAKNNKPWLIRVLKKVWRFSIFYARRIRAAKLGIKYWAPNYIYFDNFDSSSIVVDVGCGSVAEFSMHLISRYGLRAFGVDPTIKHEKALRTLQKRTHGRFKHLNFAVAANENEITFHESLENESGSILSDHLNVVNDKVRTYRVKSVTITSLLQKVDANNVDFLKLDLEGAEYELLSNATEKDLETLKQIFVEFHHHCIPRYSEKDTQAIVNMVCAKGFHVFTLDRHNYLFYK